MSLTKEQIIEDGQNIINSIHELDQNALPRWNAELTPKCYKDNINVDGSILDAIAVHFEVCSENLPQNCFIKILHYKEKDIYFIELVHKENEEISVLKNIPWVQKSEIVDLINELIY